MDDQTVIATAAGVTFASVAADKVSNGSVPSGRFIASTCLAFAALGLVAMASPDIGKGLAISVAGTAFVISGLPLVLKMFPDESTLKVAGKVKSLNNPIANQLALNAQKRKASK